MKQLCNHETLEQIIMEQKNCITIKDDAFKSIMNKLERMEEFMKDSFEIIQKLKGSFSEFEDEPLTEKAAALLLGVSVRTLQRIRKKEEIEYFRIGAKVRYYKSHILSYGKDKMKNMKKN
ncbi:DNA-binding protein [Dysgonomonas sp. 25]|nr:DNA-binding protein [Dysgonomonas sp. 25]